MKIKLIVDGGNMKPGPAVAQQLGPIGINLGKVIEDVNKTTEGFSGVKVPVELDIDPKTKEYSIKVFSPPASETIKKELGIEKASEKSGKEWAGNIAFETIVKIAKGKKSELLAKDLKSAIRLILGTCTSMGVLIDSKTSIEIGKEVKLGKYDNIINEEITQVPPEKKEELEKYFSKIKSEQEKRKKVADETKLAEEAAKTAATATTPKEEEKKEGPKKTSKKK